MRTRLFRHTRLASRREVVLLPRGSACYDIGRVVFLSPLLLPSPCPRFLCLPRRARDHQSTEHIREARNYVAVLTMDQEEIRLLHFECLWEREEGEREERQVCQGCQFHRGELRFKLRGDDAFFRDPCEWYQRIIRTPSDDRPIRQPTFCNTVMFPYSPLPGPCITIVMCTPSLPAGVPRDWSEQNSYRIRIKG